jgi:hypothetical protein
MRTLKVAAGIVSLVVLAAPGHAETVTIACEPNPAFNAPEMTLVYEGEAEGTLTITAPFGEMSLPATKEDREGTDEKGQPISATGIRASGPATVQMPEKAAIESCVKGKLPPDQLADSDIVFVTVMSCASEAPLGAEPIGINASAEIALAPLVYVGVTRTYVEPTGLAVGTIALEAYPNCSIKE